jgi:hypothetical protein
MNGHTVGIVGERDPLQPLVDQKGVLALVKDDGEVQVARDQVGNGDDRFLLMKEYFDPGMVRLECADRLRHEGCACRQEGAYAKYTGLEAGESSHLVLGRRRGPENHVRMLMEDFTRWRKPDRPAAALKEAHAEFRLQLGDMV